MQLAHGNSSLHCLFELDVAIENRRRKFPILTAVFISLHRTQAPALRMWLTSFRRSLENRFLRFVVLSFAWEMANSERKSSNFLVSRASEEIIDDWPSDTKVGFEIAPPPQSLSRFKDSGLARSGVVAGTSKSRVSSIGDMQTRSWNSSQSSA